MVASSLFAKIVEPDMCILIPTAETVTEFAAGETEAVTEVDAMTLVEVVEDEVVVPLGVEIEVEVPVRDDLVVDPQRHDHGEDHRVTGDDQLLESVPKSVLHHQNVPRNLRKNVQ